MKKKKIPAILAVLALAVLCQSCAAVTAATAAIPWWKCASWCTLKLSSWINSKADEEEKANDADAVSAE